MTSSPIIARAAYALHVMEAMNAQDPRLFLDVFTARVESAAEEATGLPREDIIAEAEFIKATDEWFELETDPGADPQDPRPVLDARPINLERVLSGLALLSPTHAPKVLHGRVIATAPRYITTDEALMRDYAGLLAGAMHLRETVWSYA